LQTLIRKHELPDAFPPEAIAEADAWGKRGPGVRLEPSDFLSTRVFTIDGADAKDFDDAVHLNICPTALQLGVHIADVANLCQRRLRSG